MKDSPTHLLRFVPLVRSHDKRAAISPAGTQSMLLRFSIVLIVVMCLVNRNALGQPSWVDVVSIDPPSPATIDDFVLITLNGVWNNSCAPDVISHQLSENTINVDVERPGYPICFTVLTPWALQEPFGQLPLGTYSVTGTLYIYDPDNPADRQLISGPDLLIDSYQVIPEPSTIMLGSLALAGLGFYRSRKHRMT